MDVIGMQRLDSGIFEPDFDSSFDDADSAFKDLFSCHDYLAFSRSLPYLEIFEIEQFTVLVRVDEDERFAFMQEHIRHFIAFLKLYRFDSAGGLSHRSEIATLEKQHPPVFRDDSYIVRIVDGFHAQDFFILRKFHDDGRELLEWKHQFFLYLFAAVLIGKEDKMMIIEVKRLGEDNLPFESEMFVQIQRILFHHKTSQIL